jgi:hypothetical protein
MDDQTGIHVAQIESGTFERSVKVFFVFLVVYLVTWGGHYTSGDGAYKIAWAKVLLFGSRGMSRDAHGVYSKFGIGHSLIAVPSLIFSSFIQRHTGIHCEGALYTLIFVINGAVLLALIAYYLFQFYDAGHVWRAVAVIGLATTWWPYTKLDFSEPLVTTCLFGGFLIMRCGRPMLGMLLGALASTIRTDAVIFIALLALWYLYQQPRIWVAAKLGIAIVPSLLISATANWIRYRSVFDHGYSAEAGFITPTIFGLYGILFSSGKSVFIFSPPLILGIVGWTRFRKRLTTRADAWLLLTFFVAELLFYSKWWDWSSDDAWGVRFMIPAVVMMCIPAVEVFGRRLLVATVVAAGILVQGLAVCVGGLDYVMLVHTNDLQREALYVSGRNRLDFEDIRFNPRYSQIAGNLILLRHLLGIPPHPGKLELVAWGGTPLYDTLPPKAWAEAARWDFIWAPPK